MFLIPQRAARGERDTELAAGVIPYYQDDKVTLCRADSTHLDFLPDGSVDLIVTSPPYNLDVSYNGYPDDVPYDRYIEWVGVCPLGHSKRKAPWLSNQS